MVAYLGLEQNDNVMKIGSGMLRGREKVENSHKRGKTAWKQAESGWNSRPIVVLLRFSVKRQN
jgi:hypothetical protein